MTLLGININPWANAGIPDPQSWAGKCDHVRLVLNRTVLLPNGHRIMGEDETVEYYTRVGRVYEAAGMSCLFVVNQQTYGDGQQTPWTHGVHWQDYSNTFAAISARLVKRLADALPNVMVQIWNEPDALPADAHSSIPLTASVWGNLHNTTAKAIRAANKDVPILTAGLCTGSINQANYWVVANRTAGTLVADYFATHPYGRYVTRVPNLPSQWYGTLEQHFIALRQRVDLAFWVTEWSVYANPQAPLDPKHDPEGARVLKELWWYMDAAQDIRGATYFSAVDTGGMYAGLYTLNHQPRQAMVDAFLSIKSAPKPWAPAQPALNSVVTRFDSVNIRNARAMCGRIVHIVRRAGTELECLDKHPEHRIGNDDDWLKVRVGEVTGYIRADMVRLK